MNVLTKTSSFVARPMHWFRVPNGVSKHRTQDAPVGVSVVDSLHSKLMGYASFAVILRQPFGTVKTWYSGKQKDILPKQFEIIAIPTDGDNIGTYNGQTIKGGNIYLHSRTRYDYGKQRAGFLLQASSGLGLRYVPIDDSLDENDIRRSISHMLINSAREIKEALKKAGMTVIDLSDDDDLENAIRGLLSSQKNSISIGDFTQVVEEKKVEIKSQTDSSEDKDNSEPQFKVRVRDPFAFADAQSMLINGDVALGGELLLSAISTRKHDKRIITRKEMGEVKKRTDRWVDPRNVKGRSARKARWKAKGNTARRLENKAMVKEGRLDYLGIDDMQELPQSPGDILIATFLNRPINEIPENIIEHETLFATLVKALQSKGSQLPSVAAERFEEVLELSPSQEVSNAVACAVKSLSQKFYIEQVLEGCIDLMKHNADELVINSYASTLLNAQFKSKYYHRYCWKEQDIREGINTLLDNNSSQKLIHRVCNYFVSLVGRDLKTGTFLNDVSRLVNAGASEVVVNAYIDNYEQSVV